MIANLQRSTRECDSTAAYRTCAGAAGRVDLELAVVAPLVGVGRIDCDAGPLQTLNAAMHSALLGSIGAALGAYRAAHAPAQCAAWSAVGIDPSTE
jgi:hypothetical protein